MDTKISNMEIGALSQAIREFENNSNDHDSINLMKSAEEKLLKKADDDRSCTNCMCRLAVKKVYDDIKKVV